MILTLICDRHHETTDIYLGHNETLPRVTSVAYIVYAPKLLGHVDTVFKDIVYLDKELTRERG